MHSWLNLTGHKNTFVVLDGQMDAYKGDNSPPPDYTIRRYRSNAAGNVQHCYKLEPG